MKSDIQNLINAGQTVTVPKQNISYNGWSGTGYISLDLKTGNGAFIIEGGSAGGDMTFGDAMKMFSKIFLAGAEAVEETAPLTVLPNLSLELPLSNRTRL